MLNCVTALSYSLLLEPSCCWVARGSASQATFCLMKASISGLMVVMVTLLSSCHLQYQGQGHNKQARVYLLSFHSKKSH